MKEQKNILNNIRISRTSGMAFFSGLILLLAGCSSSYSSSYQRPNSRALPNIPEISSTVVQRPRKKPYRPQVEKYSSNTKAKSMVITQSEVAAVNKDLLILEAKDKATVDIDPYASIPEGSSSSINNTTITSTIENFPSAKESLPATETSSAVKSLMIRARADLAIGRTQSAVSKLERGLRIESQNPNIWHLLAKAQYEQSNHQQSISMAKKSIRYTSDEGLIAQNWELIKKAGKKADDPIAIKEALDYFKVNP